MAQNSKRGRHNNNRRRQNTSNINRSLDSTGPEVKIRGTASQIFEKYQALARDSTSAGDRIRGESLSQHAEHYYRLMRTMQAEVEKREEQRAERQQQHSANEPAEAADASRPADAPTPSAEVEEPRENASEPAASGPEAGDVSEEAPKPRRSRRRRPARKSEDAEGGGDSDTSGDQPIAAE